LYGGIDSTNQCTGIPDQNDVANLKKEEEKLLLPLAIDNAVVESHKKRSELCCG